MADTLIACPNSRAQVNGRRRSGVPQAEDSVGVWWYQGAVPPGPPGPAWNLARHRTYGGTGRSRQNPCGIETVVERRPGLLDRGVTWMRTRRPRRRTGPPIREQDPSLTPCPIRARQGGDGGGLTVTQMLITRSGAGQRFAVQQDSVASNSQADNAGSIPVIRSVRKTAPELRTSFAHQGPFSRSGCTSGCTGPGLGRWVCSTHPVIHTPREGARGCTNRPREPDNQNR